MQTQTKALLAGTAAAIAALSPVPAMAYDPYDRGHGYGQGDPRARAAVDRCAARAEARAERNGPVRVDRITNVDRNRHGFLVSGHFSRENAREWGRHHRDRQSPGGWFRCRTEFGRVTYVDVQWSGH